MAKITRKSAPAAKQKSPKPAAKSAAKPKLKPKPSPKTKSAPPKSKPKPQPKPKTKPKPKPAPKSSPKPAAKTKAAPPKKPSASLAKPTRKSVPPAKAKPSPKPTVKSSKSSAAAKPPAPSKTKAKPTPSPKVAAPIASKSAPKSAPKPTAKAAPTAKAPVAKNIPAPVAIKVPANLKGKDAVRAKILAKRAKPAKLAAFSLDEVLAIARATAKTAETAPINTGPVIATKSGKVAPLPPDALKPVAPAKVKAASLADILGFNPKSRASHAENEEAAVPEKFKRYYKLLIELRNHVTGQVDQHSEETLKRSAKEDSGDLSSYGTDGGTDSFDRDFALSLVANEQEALSEIESAIQRIKAGNYGMCEHTGKPILKERLIAVPFTRYTAEAMKEIEKTRYKVRGQTGIMIEGEEGAVKMDDGGDE